MNFDKVLQLLPEAKKASTLPLSAHASGLTYITTSLREFLPPDLAPRNDVENAEQPAVIVVSAAGAVGKTTLARELAYQRTLPFWDLSLSGPVGQNSLLGAIVAGFGVANAAQVFTHLKDGSLAIVIDALDEARVKVGENAFEAFIKDVADLARGAISPRFILLGRTQIAETTWLLLSEAGLATAFYEIEPFSREQSERYIEQRIAHLGNGAAERITEHQLPFSQARALIFNQLEKAILGNRSADISGRATKEFLGYAPVLDAVAVLLHGEHNFADLIARLQEDNQPASSAGAHSPTLLLQRVVLRILEREHSEKLGKNIRPPLEALASAHRWSDWSSLYTVDEQLIRIASKVLSVPAEVQPSLPVPLRAIYEDQLASWLPEHPFLRDGRVPANVVFESYILATAMARATPLRARVELYLRSFEYKPSRLLADFYLLLKSQAGTNQVPAQHVGLLYDSVLAAESDSLRVHLSVEGPDPDDPMPHESALAEGEFEFWYTRIAAVDDATSLRFTMPISRNDTMAFSRRLKHAHVVVPCTVALGSQAAEAELGPDVHLRCHKLQILSESLFVRSRGRTSEGDDESSDQVRIESFAVESQLIQRPIVRGRLSVSWPGAAAYPWTEFASATIGEFSGNDAVAAAYRRFRRIVMTLRSHSKGSLARYREKIEHARTLQGELGERMLETLVTVGVLELRGKFYHWVPERAAATVGVSWQDLRTGIVGDRLKQFLQEFVTTNPDVFPLAKRDW